MALFDAFRPQWKHSNPEKRTEAMRLLEDDRQDVFLDVVLNDGDAGVRVAAARRLQGEDNLRKVLAGAGKADVDAPVKEILHKGLVRIVAERARTARNATPAEALVWISELRGFAGGEKALEDLSLGALSHAVRREALTGLTHASSFVAVALREDDPEIAMLAFARVGRHTHLETLAKGAKTREVRAAARDALAAHAAAQAPDEAALNRAKLGLIVTTVEKAAAGAAEAGPDFDWEAAREQVEEATRARGEFAAAGTELSATQSTSFDTAVAAFRARLAAHTEAEAARRARDEEEARVREAREAVCARLEALYADNAPVEARTLEELADAFAAAAPSHGETPEGEPLRERFRLAQARVRDKLRKQREAGDAEKNARQAAESSQRATERAATQAAEAARREAAREGAGPALEAVITELENLALNADPKTGDKRLRDLQARGKQLLALLGDAGQGAALRYHAAVDRLRETLEWSRWSNLQRKQALLEQLEALQQTVAGAGAAATTSAGADATRPLFSRFKELLAEWKGVGPVTWDSTEAIWDRYHATADALYETFRSYFAELDEEREANFKAKEELCTKLEALLASPEADSRETGEAFREAHAAWKALGAVPREKADALWDRFRAVNKAWQEKRDDVFKANLAAKRDLVARAEELKDSTAWKKTAEAIKELQEQWKAIGPVPRDKAEALWTRFHTACETFFTARRAFYDQLDAERPVNLAKKTALCESMEKLDELPDDRARYEAILAAQAEWKETGPVPREQEDALWERFRAPIDAYFEAHRERTAAERALRDEGAKAKEALCAEAEALKDSTDRRTATAFKDLQARWKASPPAPRHLDRALWTRFRAACDAYFERLKAESAARDGDPEANLRRKEDLCFAVEILSGRAAEDADAAKARDVWIETQLASGRGAPAAPESAGDWQRAAGKVKAMQQEWRTIGAVPREDNDAVWTRFRKACDAFFEEHRAAMAPAEEDPQQHLEEKLALIAEAEALAERPGLANLPVVQDIQRRWKRAGAVPRAQTEYVNDRFQAACAAAVTGG